MTSPLNPLLVTGKSRYERVEVPKNTEIKSAGLSGWVWSGFVWMCVFDVMHSRFANHALLVPPISKLEGIVSEASGLCDKKWWLVQGPHKPGKKSQECHWPPA